MILQILLVAVLPAILIAAAAWDLTSFTIPNVFPAALLVLFVICAGVLMFAPPHEFGLVSLGLHLAAGCIGLAAGLVFFGLGWIGGGDAKLFAMASLWLGWDLLLQYAVYASLFGGVLTIGIILLRRVPLPSALHGQPWLLKLSDARSGIPYGVALSIAALMLLTQSELFRLAASS